MTRNGSGPKNIPQLLIPQPAVARHPDTITHPGELERWLNELPLANPEHQAEIIHKQLKHLVRDPHPAKHYGALVNAYHARLQSLQEDVWQTLTQPGGSRKAHMQLLNAVSQLMLEVACGHMRCINIAMENGKQPEAGHLYHALLPLARLIQWDILRYNLTRPSIWRQLLHIYAIVDLYERSGDLVESEFSLDIDARNCHCIFYTALVLLLADPYRLPPASLSRLCAGIGSLASHLRNVQSANAQFKVPVDMTGKLPPLRYARLSPQEHTSSYLQLDAFLAKLHTQDNASFDPQLADWLSDSLKQLAARESGRDGRRHERHSRIANYRYVSGLTAIQRRLREIQIGNSKVSDTGGIVLETENAEESQELGMPCQQLDHSISGARFVIPDQTDAPGIGEWLLFEADSKGGGQGFVARIRRRLRMEDGRFELGVDKLQGNIVPVLYGEQMIPGLLNAEPNSGEIQLILGSTTTELTKVLILHGAQKEYRVKVMETLETSNCTCLKVSLL